ncbi:MAG TPA: alpha/beta hydrolase [Gemmatimonadaceae bacterium]|nr:alpha/beta hydrolase [Gemmatimonadaceae bacterium]
MRCLAVVFGLSIAVETLTGQAHGFVEGRSKLYYESIGSGSETIVVIHGGPGIPHNYLRPEWDLLARSGRVIYYDQNGCGKSDRVPPYGWRNHVEDLDRLLGALAPNKRVVLAGSSWGSMLALFYAYAHPDRVKALVLSGVPLGLVGTVPPSSLVWLQQQSKSRWDSVNRGLPVSKGNARPPLPSPLAQRIKEDCADVAGIVNMSMRDAPTATALKVIQAPALIIHGSDPNQMSGDGAPGLAAILPHAQLITIPNAGHDAWLDQPTTFFKAANDFLAQLPSHGVR